MLKKLGFHYVSAKEIRSFKYVIYYLGVPAEKGGPGFPFPLFFIFKTAFICCPRRFLK
jgi:hypothetical protein